MIGLLSDLDREPIVGRYYRVPCVQYAHHTVTRTTIYTVPVIGPLHDDVEVIGFEARHWHIDLRFVSERFGKVRCQHRIREEFTITALFAHPLCVDGFAVKEQSPQLRRLRCRRAMPEFPRRKASWLPALEAAYANVLAKCGVCPHRGLPLPKEPDAAGNLLCSGHGLRWKAATGELVPGTKIV